MIYYSPSLQATGWIWERDARTTTATKHHAPSLMPIAVTMVPGTDAGPNDLYVVWAHVCMEIRGLETCLRLESMVCSFILFLTNFYYNLSIYTGTIVTIAHHHRCGELPMLVAAPGTDAGPNELYVIWARMCMESGGLVLITIT